MLTDYYVTLECYKRTGTTKVDGIPVDNYTKAFDFNGVINEMSVSQIETLSQSGVNITHKIFCELVEINELDRIDWDGRQFYVVAKPKDTVGRGHHLRGYLNEIRKPQNRST